MKCEPSLQKKTKAGPRSATGSPSAPPNGMVFLISSSMKSAAAGPRNSAQPVGAGCLHGRGQRDRRHLLGRPRLGDRAGPRRHRALGRGVDGRDRASHHRLARSEVDDPPATAFAHHRICRLIGEDGGLQFVSHEEVDVLAGDLTRAPPAATAPRRAAAHRGHPTARRPRPPCRRRRRASRTSHCTHDTPSTSGGGVRWYVATTCAPAPVRTSTAAAPIPVAPPVTSMRLPSRESVTPR